MFLKVKKINQQTPGAFSIIFQKPKSLNYYPAQFLIVKYKGVEREFSLSSSPSENFLMITVKKGVSPLKKFLSSLGSGNLVEVNPPMGTYTLDGSSPAVMLAGGVGITPMRSMIKFAVDKKSKIPITLIYSNSDEDFIFKKELDIWQKSAGRRTKLTIHYINTSENRRLTEEKLGELLASHFTLLTSIFYLAGPPKMVDEFEEILIKLGVDETNIRTDRFTGY